MAAHRFGSWSVLAATVLGVALVAGCDVGTVDDPGTTHTASAPTTATPASPTSPATASPTTVPVGPPTSEPPATPSTGTSAASSPTAVDVIVTNSGWDDVADQLWVGGFVVGSEGGGVCTLTVTSGGSTVTVQQDAEPDVSTTTCGGVAIGRDRLTRGTWIATLSYASPSRAGAAQPVSIEVPR